MAAIVYAAGLAQVTQGVTLCRTRIDQTGPLDRRGRSMKPPSNPFPPMRPFRSLRTMHRERSFFLLESECRLFQESIKNSEICQGLKRGSHERHQ